MPSEQTISLVKFSRTPFGRYRNSGPKSGEAFRKEMLEPALKNYDRVVLNIDGVAGLPSSFWEEAMGGLVRAGYSLDLLKLKLEIVASDPELQTYVRSGLRFAEEAAQEKTIVRN